MPAATLGFQPRALATALGARFAQNSRRAQPSCARPRSRAVAATHSTAGHLLPADVAHSRRKAEGARAHERHVRLDMKQAQAARNGRRSARAQGRRTRLVNARHGSGFGKNNCGLHLLLAQDWCLM